MIASRTGRPPSSTGTVPDHCAVQQTAATAPGGTTPRAMSREDTRVIMAHQPSGSCSAPPPGRSWTWCASSSAATTWPDTETSATFSAEVPRSIARMCRSTLTKYHVRKPVLQSGVGEAGAARLPQGYGHVFHPVRVRMAYRCRAYPDRAQQAVLSRTFGCVRVVWNRTLATRRERYATEGKGTSYAQTNRALTVMKKDPRWAFLNEVSSVPLQQALRHQHRAFQAFFAGRARYPRFKSYRGRQSATYTRSAFRMRGGALWLAKTEAPLPFVWTWPSAEVARLDPTSVTVTKDPAGRWFVTFHVEVPDPAPLPATGVNLGIDLGLTDLAVLS